MQVLSDERVRLTEEKHEAKLLAARVEAEHKQEVQELVRSVQNYKQENKELSTSLDSKLTSAAFEKDHVSIWRSRYVC